MPYLPRGIEEYRGKYRVRFSFEDKRYLIGSYSNLKDAKNAMAIAKSEMIRGVYVTSAERRRLRKEAEEAERAKEIITVARLGEMWLDHLRAIGRTHSTIVTYQNILEKHITSQIGFRGAS
ncbi:hypothetical protein [Schaalia turicensis]|uniref:hypothetical protein n=1 Tax=Schaalia turicensis TaxID=131111 RepID=UPI00189C255E|nr:hypothetical protein [Schaalia turicensis]